jgi:hypothetical protein
MVFCAFDLYQAIANRLGVNSVPFFGLIIAVIGLIKLSVEIRNDYAEGQQVAFFIFMFGTVCIGLGRLLTKAG